MTKYDFTPADVEREVRALAAERPDFVYTAQVSADPNDVMCGYAGEQSNSTNGEGCIVGQALQRLGVSKMELLALDGEIATRVIEDITGMILADNTRWVRAVQAFQDMGMSWGGAVSFADGDEGEGD